MTDPEDLRLFAADGSQPAFARIVERHLDLVYSVALRHVRVPHLAEDIAQSVFIELARGARAIKPGTPLVAWLHVVSRRVALNANRTEVRRHARETAAVALTIAATMPAPSSDWPAIEPLLDEAVESLAPADRTAILLRFFENKSFRDVGAALRISDDAAQKRVSRALDHLRAFLGRRGLATTSTAALAADLSAAALHPAPAALGAAISSAAALVPVPTTLVPATTAAFFPKALAAATLAGALGFVSYQASAFATQREESSALRARVVGQQRALARLATLQQSATSRLAASRAHLAGMVRLTATDPEIEAAVAAWLQRLENLKAAVATHPDFTIPELVLLNEDQWLDAAREAAFDTPAAVRESVQRLHTSGRFVTATALSRAIKQFADVHDGDLPHTVAQLAPHLPAAFPPALFATYELLHTGKLDDAPPHQALLAERRETRAPSAERIVVTRTNAGFEKP